MKRIFRVVLAIILVIANMTAYCESEGMQIFYRDSFLDCFNAIKDMVVDIAYESEEEAARNKLKTYLEPTQEETQDGVIYYDNEEYSVEILAVYYDGAVNPDQPADIIGICFSKGFTAMLNSVMEATVAAICTTVDPSVTLDEIVDWMGGNLADGDTMSIEGATLCFNENDDFVQYSLYRNGEA